MTETHDGRQLRLAEFLRQALELSDDAESLAAEIVPFKENVNAGIFTIELDSSVGVAAFLIYHYLLETADEAGKTGADLFEADLRTLERSAMVDSPGPRIMAHAVAGSEAFILATTPATHRVLTGGATQPRAAELRVEPEKAAGIRSESATRLVEALADANQLAGSWLAAIRSADPADEESPIDSEFIEFNEAESALALFVLDDRSIKDLLTVLNLMIESARRLSQPAAGPDLNGNPGN